MQEEDSEPKLRIRDYIYFHRDFNIYTNLSSRFG